MSDFKKFDAIKKLDAMAPNEVAALQMSLVSDYISELRSRVFGMSMDMLAAQEDNAQTRMEFSKTQNFCENLTAELSKAQMEIGTLNSEIEGLESAPNAMQARAFDRQTVALEKLAFSLEEICHTVKSRR